MATPVFCCGCECGVTGTTGQHWSIGAQAAFDTTTVRSGARSFRFNTSTQAGGWAKSMTLTSSATWVVRAYVRWDTLPNNTRPMLTVGDAWGAYWAFADGRIHAGIAAASLGTTGPLVVANRWYRIDVKVDVSNNPWLIDVSVDGVPCTQFSSATAASSSTFIVLGSGAAQGNLTYDMYADDIIVSNTLADFPLGPGYVHHFVPTADGTHNVAGANDFEIGTGGVDITNATTTAWQLVDDIPMQTGAIGTTDFINMIAPPNATDYVECVFGSPSGIPIPGKGPRAVECIVGIASAGGAANNMEVRLNDNGTMGTIYTQTGVTLTTTITYGRAHFADPPSAATTWNAANDGGNGDFRDLRVRFGSPAVLDVNPDPYFASVMIEAEFEEQKQKITQIKQAVNRASGY